MSYDRELHKAAYDNNINKVEISIDEKDENEINLISTISIIHNRPNIAKLLIRQKRNNISHALNQAIKYNNFEIIKYLIEGDERDVARVPFITIEQLNKALLNAVFYNNLEIIQYLVEENKILLIPANIINNALTLANEYSAICNIKDGPNLPTRYIGKLTNGITNNRHILLPYAYNEIVDYLSKFVVSRRPPLG